MLRHYQYKLIKKSGLFDEKFYLKTYKDLKKDIDPLKHYMQQGWKEGLNPSSIFDTNYYLAQNPDAKNKNICPLLHKIKQDKKNKKIALKEIALATILNIHRLLKYINLRNIERFFYHMRKGNFAFIKEKIISHSNAIPSDISLDLIDEIQEFKEIEFKQVENVLVSIIIPVYNQFEFTYKCLVSIFNNTKDVEYEIIIADDVSSDETINIKKYAKNITVIRNEKNLGFLLNCNNAAKFANGKYIHFLNNDTQVQKEWLSSLVELIEADEKIGMVGSKLVYADGRQQEAGGIIWQDGSGWNYGRLDDPTKPEYNYTKEVDYISGASILIKKDLWQKIGGFDERYVPAYYEDSDLAFEVRKHGFKVVFVPRSIVVHFEGISHGTNTNIGIKSYQVKNKEKFVAKWQDELEKNHFPNAEHVFLARDRSKNKKHILIIDHYVPHFDQDAGSRTIFGYTKLFSKSGYKVTFIGDNYYKHEPYSTILEQMGVEILYGSWYSKYYKNWLSINAKYFDNILLSRLHVAEKYIDILRQSTETKIVYYGQDLHFLREEREYILTGEKQKKDASIDYKKREIALLQKVDCALTISSYEKEYIEKNFSHKHVELIPTFIYEEDNFPLSKNSDFKKREGLLFVGSFAHAPNLTGLEWFFDNIWSKIIETIPNIKFYIAGSKMPNKILSLANENIIPLGFVSEEELEKLYDKTKIVIAPLTFGAGVKGKIIEAICHGVPVVTTSIGAEGILDSNDILVVEDSPDIFAKAIIDLYKNQEKMSHIRSKQIAYSKAHFNYESVQNKLHDIFEKNIE